MPKSSFSSLIILFIFITSSILVREAESRPLKLNRGIEILFDGLYIKTRGGPSPGGNGHAAPQTDQMVVVNSGPSAGGKGHAFLTSSGPSGRGEGHAFVANSGPSSGGGGHAQVQATDSGPSGPGEGH